MANRELNGKCDCCVMKKGIDLDAEADPTFEEILKIFKEQSDEFYRILE